MSVVFIMVFLTPKENLVNGNVLNIALFLDYTH